MIMADVLKIFLLVVGTQIVVISYWLAAESLYPSLVAAARDRYRDQPVRITLLGAVTGAPLFLLGAGLFQDGSAAGKALGFTIASLTMLAALLGSAGLCRRIGAGLPSLTDAAQPWRRVLRGGVVLALMCLLPLLGWFLILPLALISGSGATVSALWARRQSRRHAPASGVHPVATR